MDFVKKLVILGGTEPVELFCPVGHWCYIRGMVLCGQSLSQKLLASLNLDRSLRWNSSEAFRSCVESAWTFLGAAPLCNAQSVLRGNACSYVFRC